MKKHNLNVHVTYTFGPKKKSRKIESLHICLFPIQKFLETVGHDRPPHVQELFLLLAQGQVEPHVEVGAEKIDDGDDWRRVREFYSGPLDCSFKSRESPGLQEMDSNCRL